MKERFVLLPILVEDDEEGKPNRCARQCAGLGNMDYCHYSGVFLVRAGDNGLLRDAKCRLRDYKP